MKTRKLTEHSKQGLLTASTARARVYRWLKENPQSSQAEICDALNITQDTVGGCIHYLKQVGLLRVMPAKYYIVYDKLAKS